MKLGENTNMAQPTVLIVEDDSSLREALCDTLALSGYNVLSANDGEQALQLLSERKVQIVVSDVQMTPMDGRELLRQIKAGHSELPVVLVTAYGTIEKAVEAMHMGAADYLVKPFDAATLLALVDRLIVPPVDDADLIAIDRRSIETMNMARRVAASDATVLITGESGTGKEVFARYIHRCSPRANQPFVAINCAAIPENMLEAILFGYEKGAFTGAYQSAPGKFELAQGGTLLLDEVSEMDLGLQAKLLRVLQEREVERLGGRKVISLDVRVIATSNRDLPAHVLQGAFREDLFYRLSVFPLVLRPLRERRDDIIPLSEYILARRNDPTKPIPTLSGTAKHALILHPWSGNVRELDNVIQRALILREGSDIQASDLIFEGGLGLSRGGDEDVLDPVEDLIPSLGDDLKVHEQRLILDAIKEGRGSRKQAAEKLGISPRTLRYKLARLRALGIDIPR